MKKIVYLLMAAMLLSLFGCKTTEANYRSAYELAVKNKAPKDTVNDGIDSDAIPEQWAEYVAFTQDAGGDKSNMKTYCVVVAQFKQIFNAKAMRNRLESMGYSKAFIVQNAKPDYYVVAQSFETVSEAETALKAISKDKNLIIRTPYPRILIAR